MVLPSASPPPTTPDPPPRLPLHPSRAPSLFYARLIPRHGNESVSETFSNQQLEGSKQFDLRQLDRFSIIVEISRIFISEASVSKRFSPVWNFIKNQSKDGLLRFLNKTCAYEATRSKGIVAKRSEDGRRKCILPTRLATRSPHGSKSPSTAVF